MRMKKIFTLVCAAVLTFGMANAKLIFQESFDGVNGEVGTLNAGGTNTEDFFDGMNYEQTRWWSYNGSSNFIQVAEGSISYSGYQTGIGNKAYLWSSGADDVRSFASSAVTSGKVYLAALINVEELSTATTGDYFMSLGDHANNYFLGRLYYKTVKEDGTPVGFKLGIAKNNESANYLHYSEEIFVPNTDMLVVIEYEFVAGEKNDIVCLYINPTKETTSPTVVMCPDTVTGGGSQQGANAKPDAGNGGIFGAFLRQGYDATAKTRSTPKVYVDEIKVATDWGDLWVEGSGEEEQDKDEVENIAALKAYEDFKTVLLKSQPVVVNDINGDLALQDESGAVLVNDFSELRLLSNAKVGDKITNLSVQMVDEDRYILGFPTARLSYKSTPEIVSSENEVEPFAVTLAEVAKYGPALVQLTGVEFTATEENFEVGSFGIKQGDAVASLVVPSECDIIGEDIPAKADITALLVKNEVDDVRIRISASADLTNRKERSQTGIETIQNTDLRSRKAVIDGQIVIIKGGKIYNVLGTEL